jgi:predicted restriction endonuclease
VDEMTQTREQKNAKQRKYASTHREKQRAYNRVYYATHKKETYATQQIWNAAHRLEINARARSRYGVNIEKRRSDKRRHYPAQREQRLAYSFAKNKALRLEVLAHYGGKCACCGESVPEFLAIDHINGGGCQHRKEIPGGNVCAWLKKNNYPEGFQVLCHNCNMAKGFYGHCPHQKEEVKHE